MKKKQTQRKQTKSKSPKRKTMKPPTVSYKLEVAIASLANLERAVKDLISQVASLTTIILADTSQDPLNPPYTPTYTNCPPYTPPCQPFQKFLPNRKDQALFYNKHKQG